MLIAVDFDGTIVKDEYPAIGKELPFATTTLKALMNEGHHFILWTVRRGRLLDEAVEWCRERGVEFYAVNQSFEGEDEKAREHHYSRKLKVDMFIDDRNVGGLPAWSTIYDIIHEKKTYEEILLREAGMPSARKKKSWWPF